MSKHKFNNILLTGAAGALGNQLRETLSKECDLLRISDKVNLEKKFHNEEVEIANLASTESILKLTKDMKHAEKIRLKELYGLVQFIQLVFIQDLKL